MQIADIFTNLHQALAAYKLTPALLSLDEYGITIKTSSATYHVYEDQLSAIFACHSDLAAHLSETTEANREGEYETDYFVTGDH